MKIGGMFLRKWGQRTGGTEDEGCYFGRGIWNQDQ